MKSKVTIRDIAKAANYSLATVSRAFDEDSSINEKTRQEILRAANRLNYSPNRAASALRSGRTNIIGVVVPEIDRSFFASVVKGIEVECQRRGYNILICQSHESLDKEKEVLQTLLRLQVDGVIISASMETHTAEFLRQLKDNGIAVTFFDRVIEMPEVSSVVLNDFNGGYKATNHLIERGRQRILHIGGDQRLQIFKQRKEGYLNALIQAGLIIPNDQVIECRLEPQEVGSLLSPVIHSDKRPDAIFASNDYLALAAIQFLQKLGLKIPEDIAVVGFGNSSFTELVNPSITSIDQQSYQMGLTAAKVLIDEKKAKDEFVHLQSVLEPKLFIRESSQ